MRNRAGFLTVTCQWTIFFALPWLLCLSALAQSKGQASGTLTINDGNRNKTVELKYVYATKIEYPPSVQLTFTDKPLPDDPVKRWRYAQFAGAEGKLTTLIIMINTGKEIEHSVLFLDTQGTPAADRDCWVNFEDTREREDFYNDPKDEQLFESKVFNDQTISGTIRSSLLQDADYRNKKVSYQYRLTFNAQVRDALPEADTLPADSEARKTYRKFLQALEAGDFETTKKFFIADRAKLFEGSDGQRRLVRLKALTAKFQRVGEESFISADGKCALLFLNNAPVNAPASPDVLGHTSLPDDSVDIYMQQPDPSPDSAKIHLVPTEAPPPPPPPPPPAPTPKMNAVLAEPIGIGGVTRMINENGQWKIDWQSFDPIGSHSLLRLDTYKSPAEREAEYNRKTEAARKADEELFRLTNPKPLPAGGGEAGNAYLELCKAEKAKDKATYLKYVTGEQAEFFSKPDKAVGRGGYAWAGNSAIDHQNLKVMSAMTAGNKAVLNVSASRSYVYGNVELRWNDSARVLMINEGGQWKVIRQIWKPGKMIRVPLQKNKR